MESERPYTPIDCSVHDTLESLATLHRVCDIIYRDGRGERSLATDVIEDVYTEGSAEFVRLRSGATIRLDELISVDGRRVVAAS